MLRIALLICAVALVESAAAQDQAMIEAGAELYQENCSSCHGERLMNPGAALDLRKLGADERPRFDRAVTDGKGQMPAWGGVLSPEEFDQLWAYIRSRAR